MGVSLTSVHILSDETPAQYSHLFRSFSPNRMTCISDFDGNDAGRSYKFAEAVSRETNAPVLYFAVFDSEMIWFVFFRNGRRVSLYSDDESVSNKKLYEIPSLIGYGDGQKKRLSTILSCSDIDTKISMLEEYFGVCLLFYHELMDEPESLLRNQSDRIYQHYMAQEKALTGKRTPFDLHLIAEYPGKLFYDVFGKFDTIKPHFFLHGYASEAGDDMTPVQFIGQSLEEATLDKFEKDRAPLSHEDPRFNIHFETPCKVTFSEKCPAEYRGRTMTMPRGFYPLNFLPSGELLLYGSNQIVVVDITLKIIAKLSIKGEIADIVDNCVLATVGDSFYGYCYDPKAKIYIYKIIKK